MGLETSYDVLSHNVPTEVDIYVSKGMQTAKEVGVPEDQIGTFIAGYVQACATEMLSAVFVKELSHIMDEISEIANTARTWRRE